MSLTGMHLGQKLTADNRPYKLVSPQSTTSTL